MPSKYVPLPTDEYGNRIGTRKWLAMQQYQAIQEFIAETLEVAPPERGNGITSDAMYRAWLEWSEPRGCQPETKAWLARRILEYFGPAVFINRGGSGQRVYRGLIFRVPIDNPSVS